MRRKKVLVHGTLENLQKFFSDAVSRDFEVIAVLSDEPEKISIKHRAHPIDVFKPKTLPRCLLKLVDGIIFTGDKSAAEFFLQQEIEPRKIILWDAQNGWEFFGGIDKNGVQVMFVYGLEFHIRNEDDAKFFNETLWRLQTNRQFKNLNPQFYPAVLSQDFQKRMGKPLDFNNLQTFTEKLQWIKIFDATPLKSRLADKYTVRNWVAEKIGEQYLIPLLGVWDSFDEINFDELPDKFVLKCNHGSGMNIICRDKKNFDVERAREKLNAWLAFDYGAGYGLEVHYSRIDRKIIAEKYIEEMNGGLLDYKIHCFDGRTKFFQVIGDRDLIRHTGHQNFYDLEWKDLEWHFEDYPSFPHPIVKPVCLDEMKRCAEILSESFSYVRVDFYEIDGKVYFGEMTFTPANGYYPYKKTWTQKLDFKNGSLLKLPATITPPPPRYVGFIVQRPTKIFAQDKLAVAA